MLIPPAPKLRDGVSSGRVDAMNGVETYLRTLDDAWEHKWESLTAALDGVDAEMAAHQAPCYSAEEREKGWPAPGTIHWQVAHVAHCKRHYTDFIRSPGSTERPPDPERPQDLDFEAELANLREVHAAQREAIAALSEDDLKLPVGNGMPLEEFLAMAIRHDTWHASQIVVARRLWSSR